MEFGDRLTYKDATARYLGPAWFVSMTLERESTSGYGAVERQKLFVWMT